MNNVTPLHPPQTSELRYRQGDIGRALLEGLKREGIAADIEQVLHEALFFPEQEHKQYGALVSASNVLHNLLNAMPSKPQTPTD
mgnify:CR=1 FL=1|jgi:hypothetical protein|tara:strand:- start:3585 stop:3836 length:252 start_codon:yes stop_codon:yes gene_type:complete